MKRKILLHGYAIYLGYKYSEAEVAELPDWALQIDEKSRLAAKNRWKKHWAVQIV